MHGPDEILCVNTLLEESYKQMTYFIAKISKSVRSIPLVRSIGRKISSSRLIQEMSLVKLTKNIQTNNNLKRTQINSRR